MKMEFNAIFFQASLAISLKYPLAEESEHVASLKCKKKNITPQTLGSPKPRLTKQTASAPLVIKLAVNTKKRTAPEVH